jgi:aminoglycoside phosphotransferase (APT) family kinase protein
MLPFDFLPDGIANALGVSRDATFRPAPQGMTSEVAFVDEGNRRAVLKRCCDARYVGWLRREHRVLEALSACPLRVPRVLGYHEVHEDDQVVDAWLLMTRLAGASLWDLLLRSEPSVRAARLHSLGVFLRTLHATPPPEALRASASWVERKLDQARANLEWCDGSSDLLAQLGSSRPAPVDEVLIHGDLALDNVLVADDGRMSLIDWSGGDVGDPRYDISLALATEPELTLGKEEIGAFFDGYRGIRPDAATTRWFVDLYEFF